MPCARHEDSVPLVAVAEALCSNPPFRCFEIFGATLPFNSNLTVPSTTTARWNWFSENLFTWPRQACRLTSTHLWRMGLIPAVLNSRPSANLANQLAFAHKTAACVPALPRATRT